MSFPAVRRPIKALVGGWFSFPNGHATAGDLLSGNLVCEWLRAGNIACDLATDPPFTGGLDWRRVDPANYTHLIFVCGPYGRGELEAEILLHFACCRLVGLNLSMNLPLERWNPFDLLIERDSSAAANVDLVFGAPSSLPPVVGVCLVEEHLGADVARANAAIDSLLQPHELARVRVDTRLDWNEAGLRTPGEVEALIGRMDVLITTRLHGLVLALKNGVPAIAIDAVPGGGKVSRQCRLLKWPSVFTLDRLDRAAFDAALAHALTAKGRAEARACADRAVAAVDGVRVRLLGGIGSEETEASFLRRTEAAELERFRADLRGLFPEEPASSAPRSRAHLWRRAAAVLSRF